MRTSTTVLLVCLFALAGYSAEADVSEGRIAFVSDRDGDNEIFVMDADGSNQTQLTFNDCDDNFPTWNPDGSRIAYCSKSGGNWEVFTMDTNGRNQIRLTDNDVIDIHPSWNPDGNHIIFASNRDGDNDIFSMNADGNNQTPLTVNDFSDDTPSFSPDGKLIAFSRNGAIFTMEPNGNNQAQLTTCGDMDMDLAPVWDPDGNRIAYNAIRNLMLKIFLVDTDGNNQTPLPFSNENSAVYGSPSWSPDGNWIVFSLWSEEEMDWELCRMNLDGSNLTQLTTNDTNDSFPAWCPVVE